MLKKDLGKYMKQNAFKRVPRINLISSNYKVSFLSYSISDHTL